MKDMYATIKTPIANEHGFTLVLALAILLMLTTFGIWALHTSTAELDIAGGNQRIEEQFNIIEGAAYTEAAEVGFTLELFYQITDPTNYDLILTPPSANEFDPGKDSDDVNKSLQEIANNPSSIPANVQFWPRQNLLRDNNDDTFDYRYLVTYLNSDMPPMGYNANKFASYKFRIQAASPTSPVFVELGGQKIGPR